MKQVLVSGSVVTLIVALSLSGCSSDSGGSAPEVFPNRRTKFPAEGRTLGYVANQRSDTVSVIDLDALVHLGQATVGRNPIDVDGPRRFTLDGAAGLGYVVLSYPLSAPGAHAAQNGIVAPWGYVQALALADLAPVGDARVDRRAANIALSDDNGMVAVVHYDQELSLLGSDLESRRANLALLAPAAGLQTGTAQERSVRLCVAPSDVVFGKGTPRAYVACTGEDALAVVDTASATVLARVPAGDYATNKPTAIAIDPAGAHILLSNEISTRVVTFTATDMPALVHSTDDLPGLPRTVTFVSDSEYLVPLQDPNGIARIDAATGSMLGHRSYTDAECLNPQAVSVAADGRLFLVCEGDHYSPGSVVRLDATTLEIQGKVLVGLYPDQLAIRNP